MKIYNEVRQTLSQQEDNIIRSLNVRIRAKRVSGLRRAMHRESLQELIERSLCKEVIW